ncbi:MAG: hypothetical protein LUH56_05160 [Oscillospiraceae bacterium]|nr:hypothetical protein [Oscillospiraceae bacterium]
MRKLVAMIVAVLLLTGCESSDVRKRLVVTAIGIGENTVTYQAFSPENEIEVYTYVCDNLPEAEEKLALETGKEVFLGDVELIAFSGSEDIEPYLDYLWHSPDIYMGTAVVFCEGSPGKLFETPSDEITGILAVADVKVGLIDLYNGIYSDGGIAKVPLFSSAGEISGEILLKSSSECDIIALYDE